MKKNVIIYGASSLISLELIKLLDKDVSRFFLFCRKKNEIENFLTDNNFDIKKFTIFEVDILDIEKNLEYLNQIKSVDGIIWVAGFSGDSGEELKDLDLSKKNVEINFLNPMLIINKILTKMTLSVESFLVVITSVAGLRGRGKNLIYGSAKAGLIAYLSGLRQKYNQKLTVVSVIPGYIKTKNFKIKAPNFLICEPSYLAKKIIKAIKYKHEIIYSSFAWRVIMLIIRLIPEKIFKKFNF